MHYDAIVIGAGQGGVPLAVALAQAGRKTAMIERRHVGGTCVNEGCTPTKTMVASARTAYQARRGAEFGVRTGDVSVDLPAVIARKQRVVDDFRTGNEHRLTTGGVDLIMAEARFENRETLTITPATGPTRTLTAPVMVINTGGRPTRPNIPGLDSVPSLDSTSIMEVTDLPAHLVVIGGGYVGLEFAQMFRRFGSAVTVIQRGPHLLGNEDPDIADLLAEILASDGIEILRGAATLAVERPTADAVSVRIRDGNGERAIAGSHLLVATGRSPNTESLNPAAAGIALREGGFIRVNERLETSAPGVYAIGDVNGGPAFTHISYDDYRILKRNLIGDGQGTTTGRPLPYTVFTDPQLGRIGLTETGARAAGHSIRVAKMPMSHVARAIETNEVRGMMKVVIDSATNQIIGAAILGMEGGEIMGALQIAMMGKVPYQLLRDGIWAHPTLMEALNNLLASV